MKRILNLFAPTAHLEGSEIASFRIPQRRWQIAVKNVGITCILVFLAQQAYFLAQQANSKPPPNEPAYEPLWIIGLAASFISGSRQIRFYEKGLRIPKAAGYVFLSCKQIVDMKLDGSDFIVIGSDADWGGPYSGGRFRVSAKDLPRFLDILARFTPACDTTSG